MARAETGPIPETEIKFKRAFLFFGRKAIKKVGVFTDYLMEIDVHLLIHFTRVSIGIGHMQEIADPTVSTTIYLAVIFVKIPLMYSYIRFLYRLFNICPTPASWCDFPECVEHLFHVRLGEVNQNRTAMRTVIRVVALGQLIDQIARGVIIQGVIGLDGAFAGHHDSQLRPVFLDGHFLGQEEHITSHRYPTQSLLPSSR